MDEIDLNNPETMDAIIAAFAAAATAMQAVVERIRAAFLWLTDALSPYMRRVVRMWWHRNMAHRIPRQYRDSIMRRKLRRYAQQLI